MRRVAASLATAGAVAALAGCGGGSGPADTVQRYLDAENAGRGQEACGLLAPSRLAEFGGRRSCAKEVSKVRPRTAGTAVGDATVSGSTATVTVSQGPSRAEIDLRRLGGGWRISGGRVLSAVYRIPSEGMSPTYRLGARVMADATAYDHRAPARGDVIVFHPPVQATGSGAPRCGSGPVQPTALCASAGTVASSQSFIKRIVAVAGDRIAVRGGRVVLDGRPLAEPYARPCSGVSGCDDPQAITVPAGTVYVLGDNRGNSDDSRYWGPVRLSWIVGRVVRKLG